MDGIGGRLTRRGLLGGALLLAAGGAGRKVSNPAEFVRDLYASERPEEALSGDLRRRLMMDQRRTHSLIGTDWLRGDIPVAATIAFEELRQVNAWPKRSVEGYNGGPIVRARFRGGDVSAARIFDLAPKGMGWQVVDVILLPQSMSVLEQLGGRPPRVRHAVHEPIMSYQPPPGPPQSMQPPSMPR